MYQCSAKFDQKSDEISKVLKYETYSMGQMDEYVIHIIFCNKHKNLISTNMLK